MKLDSHQHFWHYKAEEYDWMGPGMEDLQSDHLPANLFPLLAAARIDGTIAVQARQTLEETRWLLSLARQHAFIKGVVGWVDLCSPDVREQLAGFSADPKFVGVRHVVHDEADGKFMLQESFIHGIGALAEFGLTYDLLLFPQHLPVACELVARFPEQPFILDHIAKPFIKDGVLVPWDADLRRLAAFPNVVCKVSGMVTEAAWNAWEPADFRPYLDVVFEAFGAERIMFGSDWPVCTVAASYREVVSIETDYVEGLSADEREAVWGGTAARCYGN
ncbi:MAG: amidohydrolase family protein [Anaerolineae bacterium]|nr:amidohydrolase family protein [Anaerolineae bacterium]